MSKATVNANLVESEQPGSEYLDLFVANMPEVPAAATKEKAGLVKQAAHVANAGSGEGSALQTKVNEIIKALVDAKIMAAS